MKRNSLKVKLVSQHNNAWITINNIVFEAHHAVHTKVFGKVYKQVEMLQTRVDDEIKTFRMNQRE